VVEKVHKERRDTLAKDDPLARCLPRDTKLDTAPNTPFRIMQMPNQVLILYEAIRSSAMIFTDGRAFPEDPQPAFMGYSRARVDGDTLVWVKRF